MRTASRDDLASITDPAQRLQIAFGDGPRLPESVEVNPIVSMAISIWVAPAQHEPNLAHQAYFVAADQDLANNFYDFHFPKSGFHDCRLNGVNSRPQDGLYFATMP
jgi:hypothetical protein